ncbi:HGGxSTG domain-containing protein, partial [Haematobacter massiliensis]
AERMAAQDRAREAAFMAQVTAWEARDAQRREEQRAKLQVRCKARTRKGTSCRCKSEPGKKRCKFHGGMSTGARTPEGLERIREAQRRRWARWRAEKDSRD